MIRDLKTFCFNFDWPKYVAENLKYEIEFIIKSDESVVENKIKTRFNNIVLKYKLGNNIHEQRKQQNE